MINGIIYMFENKINHKKYIGKTIRPKERYKEHKRAKHDSFFHNAIRKYGFENFEYTVLLNCEYNDKKEANHKLDKLEKHYISIYNTNDSKFGYNLTDGGEGGCGCLRSAETKQKMSMSKIGNKNPMKRKSVSKKVSKALKGRKGKPCTEEQKQKASKRMLGKNNPMFNHFGKENPSYGVDWTKKLSKSKYKEFCKHRHQATIGNKNPMYGRKQNKSLWLLPDGSKKIMANCSVAAKHKDWIKISDYEECVVQK